jgi:anionic cell wall polymer biosynthesis LytR-Cps2A-Psr (LCP) family protein
MSIRRSRAGLSALLLTLVMAGSGSLAGPVSAADFKFNPGAWLNAAMAANAYFPAIGEALQAISGPSQLSYNGKLTVLLVGSDWRDGNNNGERLDSIMVVSVDASHHISAVSIPRDTARIPIPPALGGGIYNGKINGMFKYFKKQTGSQSTALDRFKQTVEYVLNINIDYVAFLRFEGFDKLVDQAGGVYTAIPYELRDDSYIDKPGDAAGAKFLVSSSALLKGAQAPRCVGGYPKPTQNWAAVPNCTRALVYVRSRHGKLVGCCGNNDYKRAARQQKFVFDAVKRILAQGQGTAQGLVTVMNNNSSLIYTTVPHTNGDIAAMFTLLSGSGSALYHSQVFSPPTYASHISGTSSNQLKLDVVRSLCDSWFDHS